MQLPQLVPDLCPRLHAVALVVITASRGGRSVEVNEAHVFHMRDGKVMEFRNASADQYAFDELIG